jgi:hypothetical protein
MDEADAPLGVPVEASPREWDANQNSCLATAEWRTENPEHKHLVAALPRPGFLILRLRAYPAWRLRLNGQTVQAAAVREDGLVALAAPEGRVDVTADWTATPATVAGRWLSALGLMALTALCVLTWRRGRTGLF